MRLRLLFAIFGFFVVVLFFWYFIFSMPTASSTKSSAALSEQELNEKIAESNKGDCSAMVALGDHFFFGLNNSYGAIFWYERALDCGRKDTAKYLKEIYSGLGLLTNAEAQRFDQVESSKK